MGQGEPKRLWHTDWYQLECNSPNPGQLLSTAQRQGREPAVPRGSGLSEDGVGEQLTQCRSRMLDIQNKVSPPRPALGSGRDSRRSAHHSEGAAGAVPTVG